MLNRADRRLYMGRQSRSAAQGLHGHHSGHHSHLGMPGSKVTPISQVKRPTDRRCSGQGFPSNMRVKPEVTSDDMSHTLRPWLQALAEPKDPPRFMSLSTSSGHKPLPHPGPQGRAGSWLQAQVSPAVL